MCAHRVVPPFPLQPLAVAGELARGAQTDCIAIIIMEFPCNASVDDVLDRAIPDLPALALPRECNHESFNHPICEIQIRIF